MKYLKKLLSQDCPIKEAICRSQGSSNTSKRDRSVSERALLAAGLELFAQKGFESTRTLDVAKRAGVNESLITRYFGGKEGLLMALLQDPQMEEKLMPTECVQGLQSMDQASGLKEALDVFFKKSGEAIAEKETFMRIFTSRALLDESIAKSMRKMILDRRLPEIEEGIRGLMSQKSKSGVGVSVKLSEEEIEAIALLVGASNFALNFFARRIHRFNDKRISQALSILSAAIEQFVENKPSVTKANG
jgi:AcrR family transcriptional regulator